MKKNQGFSLVELIVVIAIMAVLVGVLAPAYLRYVEKSRKSSDISSISDIVGAGEKVAVDVQFDLPADSTLELAISSGVVSLTVKDNTGSTDNDATTEWQSIAGAYTCKSKEFKKSTSDVTITGWVQDNGSVTWSASPNTSPIITYSPDFANKWGIS